MAENKLQVMEDLKKRLSVAKEVGDRAGKGRAYGNLGNTYYSLGRFQEAIECQNQPRWGQTTPQMGHEMSRFLVNF